MLEFILGIFLGSMVTLIGIFIVFAEIQFKEMNKIRKRMKW